MDERNVHNMSSTNKAIITPGELKLLMDIGLYALVERSLRRMSMSPPMMIT